LLKPVPVPAGRHEQRAGSGFGRLVVAVHEQSAAEHVDRLVEFVVRVRDGPGEVRRHGQLHGREAGGQAILACEDVHRLASVRECRTLAAVGQQGHASFLSCPAGTSREQRRGVISWG
jgi:hypothetical protein